MQNQSLAVVVTIALLSIFVGCKKDNYSSEPQLNGMTNGRDGTDNVFISGGTQDEDTIPKLTVLGGTRKNPYTVQNFTAAYNDLYEPDIQTVETTHFYIKFMPTSNEQVMLLAESDINVYDYPLDRKVVEMGDYYVEPGASPNQIPAFYASVKTTQQLPNVPYQILEKLHLNSTNEQLIKQAFIRLDYSPDDLSYIIPPEDDGGSGGGPGTEFGQNSCGCTVFLEERKPGGCVQVWDSEYEEYQPVRRVKIIMKDEWFTENETWTDDNGCFRINNKYYNHGWLWVRFKSDRVQIRGTKEGISSVYQWAYPIKDYVGAIAGPVFNNIQVKYAMWANQGSQGHVHWGAATVNNAVYEFDDYATAEGINPAPYGLDMYVGRKAAYGYALMGSQNLISGAAYGVLQTVAYFFGPFGDLVALIGSFAIKAFLPDVFIGIDFHHSDALKRVTYHELAHASHYSKVGTNFWNELVTAEIYANGHGNSSSTNAPLISLCESWADHIGFEFAHKRYGGNTSAWDNYNMVLERTRNESENHVPVGFYHDLRDLHSDDVPACNQISGGCGMIQDDVVGFTNGEMFGQLNASTKNVWDFTTQLTSGSSIVVQNKATVLLDSY